jgi:hypothetical protein
LTVDTTLGVDARSKFAAPRRHIGAMRSEARKKETKKYTGFLLF